MNPSQRPSAALSKTNRAAPRQWLLTAGATPFPLEQHTNGNVWGQCGRVLPPEFLWEKPEVLLSTAASTETLPRSTDPRELPSGDELREI